MSEIVQDNSLGEDTTLGKDVADYWTEVNVTGHQIFKTPEESLEYFYWRNDQYRGYIERMPVDGQDNKVVLDYGCGPGNDLVGFRVHSKPARLIGMDVSSSSLKEAELRLSLHGGACEFIRIDPESNIIPLPDASVDYIHSSGVLHHVPDLMAIMKELRRIIKPNGMARIMVYNYDSIWVHHYVAYKRMIAECAYAGMTIREAFAKTTDGPGCPISHVYKPEEFISQVAPAGFEVKYTGAAISMHEFQLFQERSVPISEVKLAREHRRFLLNLEMDACGYPIHNGYYAGVDGCYELYPK